MKPPTLRQKILLSFAAGLLLLAVGIIQLSQSLAPMTASVGYFADVDAEHPYAGEIEAVYLQGIMQGYSDRTFRPTDSITRAEFVKTIARFLADESEETRCLGRLGTAVLFTDIPAPADLWFGGPVCLAKELGWIGGYPDGTFRPAKTISVPEAAAVFARAFELPVAPAGPEEEWFVPYILALHNHQLIPPSLSLQADITRSEVAWIIARARSDEPASAPGGTAFDPAPVSLTDENLFEAAPAASDEPSSVPLVVLPTAPEGSSPQDGITQEQWQYLIQLLQQQQATSSVAQAASSTDESAAAQASQSVRQSLSSSSHQPLGSLDWAEFLRQHRLGNVHSAASFSHGVASSSPVHSSAAQHSEASDRSADRAAYEAFIRFIEQQEAAERQRERQSSGSRRESSASSQRQEQASSADASNSQSVASAASVSSQSQQEQSSQSSASSVQTNYPPAPCYGASMASISENGRYVVFLADYDNVDGPSSPGSRRVFLRDTVAGTTQNIGWSQNTYPVITPDGRYVLYVGSPRAHPVSGKPYVIYDRTTGQSEVIAANLSGRETELQQHYSSVVVPPYGISLNGQYVVFGYPVAMNQNATVIYDRTARQYHIAKASRTIRSTLSQYTERVHFASAGGRTGGHNWVIYRNPTDGSFGPADQVSQMSYDGGVELVNDMTNLNITLYYLGRSKLIGQGSFTSMTYGGTIVAFHSGTDTSTVYSLAGEQRETLRCSLAVISGGGWQVVCQTNASLAENDTNGLTDVYLYNRSTKEYELISVSSNGRPGACSWDDGSTRS